MRMMRSIAIALCALPMMANTVEEKLAALDAATKAAQSAGDNAWMLVSSALVLMMTGPGLALFYGGLVRKKNVLGTMMQSFALMALVTVLWAVVGYSLTFGEGSPVLGGLQYLFLNGVGGEPNGDYAATIPHQTFMVYQLMFAIITPALIVGAIAERMKFSAILLFVTIWMFVVYFPLAHMIWGIDGLMNGVWICSTCTFEVSPGLGFRYSTTARATGRRIGCSAGELAGFMLVRGKLLDLDEVAS